MRPKSFTPRRLILLLSAAVAVASLARWASLGFPLPGQSVPSTAGKLTFVTSDGGKANLGLLDPESGTAERLTTDGLGNDEPAFSTDGNTLYFTAERSGVRQLCAMDAAPGRNATPLTRTTTTKQQPLTTPDGRVYFLDGGKITSTTRDASDPRIIFPTAEGLNENPYLKALFAEGGVTSMLVSADGKRIVMTIKREQGQVLAVHLPEEPQPGNDKDGHNHTGVTMILGMGERILPQLATDGSLGALFVGGSPFKEPMAVPMPPHEQAEQLRMMEVSLPLPPASEAMKEVHVLSQFDKDLKPGGQFRIPMAPKAIAFAPSKDQIALAGDEQGGQVGLIAVAMTGEQAEPKMLYDKPCQDLSWAPDASMLAFSDGTDIFVVPADGSQPPQNVTRGKAGKATRPIWSPIAKPQK